MAGGIDWFRWHHGSVSDQKFVLVARRAGASVAEVIAVWACLLEAASAAEVRGCAGDVDHEAMDCALGMPDGRAFAINQAMQARDLVSADGLVQAWEKRQPKRERTDDNSTERSRAFRQKQRQETPCNATQRQETPRGEESREEPIQAPPASRVPPAEAGQAKAIRGLKRCPDSFAITDDLREFVRAEGIKADVGAELAKFRDHTFRTARSDWPATFRNWLREADARIKPINSAHTARQAEAAKWIKGTSLDPSRQPDYFDDIPAAIR